MATTHRPPSYAKNAQRVREWRARNVLRARKQWREYYYRRLKLIRCGIDPDTVTA